MDIWARIRAKDLGAVTDLLSESLVAFEVVLTKSEDPEVKRIARTMVKRLRDWRSQ